MVRKARLMWPGLVFLAGLSLTSAAEPENPDGAPAETRPQAVAETPSEPGETPGPPSITFEPLEGFPPPPGAESQAPGEAPPDEGRPTLPGFRSSSEPPGELTPPPRGGPNETMPAPGRDPLAGVSALKADEELRERFRASVLQSRQRLAGLNTELRDLRTDLADARRVEAVLGEDLDRGLENPIALVGGALRLLRC